MILILIVVILVAIAAFWFAMPRNQPEEIAEAEPAHQADEWVVAPEGGIDVNLPETPMTNAPVEGAAEEVAPPPAN